MGTDMVKWLGASSVVFLLLLGSLLLQQRAHKNALLYRQSQEIQVAGGTVMQSTHPGSSWPKLIDLRNAIATKDWLLERLSQPEYYNSDQVLLRKEQLSEDDLALLKAKHPTINIKIEN